MRAAGGDARPAGTPRPPAPAEPLFESDLAPTQPSAWSPETAVDDEVLPETIPPGRAEAPAPLSSSTLAELYVQQGLPEQAREVYRQVLEAEPANEKAKARFEELQRGATAEAALDGRAARRRALERTIGGLERLLVAVRRR